MGEDYAPLEAYCSPEMKKLLDEANREGRLLTTEGTP
jgi:hypothetical protein